MHKKTSHISKALTYVFLRVFKKKRTFKYTIIVFNYIKLKNNRKIKTNTFLAIYFEK